MNDLMIIFLGFLPLILFVGGYIAGWRDRARYHDSLKNKAH